MMIAALAALALAQAYPLDEEVAREIAPCRVAALESLKGNPRFLEDYIQAMQYPREKRARLRLMCIVYLSGAMDGVAIQAAKDDAAQAKKAARK